MIEFRHNSWINDDVFEILKKNGVSFCVLSAPVDLQEKAIKTSDPLYMRFHGRKHWYKYHYSKQELQEWANKLKTLNARQIYAYFNNDHEANAPENASEFAAMISE